MIHECYKEIFLCFDLFDITGYRVLIYDESSKPRFLELSYSRYIKKR